MKRMSIVVRGIVQGVFFRASTKKKAIEFDINGFVRNEPDGSVFIEAEGSEENLGKLLAWCKEGPPHARVSGTHVNGLEGLRNYTSFTIQR